MLFLIPDFLIPNIYYSFSFKTRCSLFSFHSRLQSHHATLCVWWLSAISYPTHVCKLLGVSKTLYLFFFKECCFRVRVKVRVVTLIVTLNNPSLTLTLTLKQHSLKKKRELDPGPGLEHTNCLFFLNCKLSVFLFKPVWRLPVSELLIFSTGSFLHFLHNKC